jgi:glucose dehydrogenase
VHVKKALRQKATLIERAVVTELRLDTSGNIAAILYRSWDGELHTVTGRIVVLAANAIESAKILQLSNGGKGIANLSDQVGRNLMDHIGGEGAALMPFATFPFRGPQSTSCIEDFRDHKYRDKFAGVRLTIGNDGWGRTKHPYQNLKDMTGGDLKDPATKRLFGAELQAELLNTVSQHLPRGRDGNLRYTSFSSNRRDVHRSCARSGRSGLTRIAKTRSALPAAVEHSGDGDSDSRAGGEAGLRFRAR